MNRAGFGEQGPLQNNYWYVYILSGVAGPGHPGHMAFRFRSASYDHLPDIRRVLMQTVIPDPDFFKHAFLLYGIKPANMG